MNAKHYIGLLWVTVLTSCDLAQYEVPPITQPPTPPTATTSVAKVITRFLPTSNDPTPIDYEITPKGDEELIISGIVTSSDAEANANGYIVVQELDAYIDRAPRAIRINIEAAEPLFHFFPLGQQVSVHLNYLKIKRIARCPQLAKMPLITALSVIKRYGSPDAKLLNKIAKYTLLEELSFPQDIWRLVVFSDVTIVKNESEPGTFTRSAQLNDSPTSHLLVDKFSYPKGYAITSFSGSHFGSSPLPSGRISIRAIVSWYDNTPTTTLNYQPTLVDNSAQEHPIGLGNYQGPRLSLRLFSDLSQTP